MCERVLFICVDTCMLYMYEVYSLVYYVVTSLEFVVSPDPTLLMYCYVHAAGSYS